VIIVGVGALFADYRPDDSGTPGEVAVRVMGRADRDSCVALAVARDGGDPAVWAASFERNLAAEDRATFVALLEDRVVGYGTAGWFAPRAIDPGTSAPDGWYLLGLVVDPQVRRQGVGRRLTSVRLGWIKERADRAWYFVSSANPASIDLHREFGFELVDGDVRIPGATFTASGRLYGVTLATQTPPKLTNAPEISGAFVNFGGVCDRGRPNAAPRTSCGEPPAE